MSKPKAEEKTVSEAIKNGSGDRKVWISKPRPLENTGAKVSTVFYPDTGETLIVQRTYNLVGGLDNKIDLSKVLAKKENDVWEPGPNAANGYLDVEKNLAEDPNYVSKLNTSVKSTIKAVYASKNNGQLPTPNQITLIENGSQGPNDESKEGTDDDVKEEPTINDGITSVSNTTDTFAALSEQIKAESASVRSLDRLSYPENFPENMDYILFEAKKYGTKTFDSSTFGFGTRSNEGIGESVKLPIQPSISDGNSVGWNEQTMNPAQIAGADISISGITGGIEGFLNTLSNKITTAQGAATDVEAAIIAYFTQEATGAQILPKLGGAIFNPNTELLFQGPQLRPFNFTFKLSPRSDTESERVKKIIGFFKRNMAAKTSNSQLYLKAPNVFGIRYYLNGQEDHPGINLIKDCALQSCVVNYTPQGSYMAYEDGGMASYDISLQFMELEPIYSKDYDDDRAANHLIGY